MRRLKLGTQLNISFALVLFVPMIIAVIFSIVYYSNKIQQAAVNAISSEMKIADIIYQNAVTDMKNLANAYAQQKVVTVLLSLNLGEKLGGDLAKSANLDNIDMITIVDTANQVMVRSHAPKKISDVIADKSYIAEAISGEAVSGTETMTLAELEQEGFNVGHKLFAKADVILTLTGVAPVYDRQRENIVGAIIVRRILNKDSEIIKNIAHNLNINAALFEHANLIAGAAAPDAEEDIIPPPPNFLHQVLGANMAMHIADISEGGTILKCMPVKDFNKQPVGALMVQTGVAEYIRTRNIAVVTLIAIFLTGFVLAFSIKTIIARRIIIPVQRLKEGTERIGDGDYTHSLEVVPGDEIGELTEAFNKMAMDLHEYDRQLKDYNLQLEARVKERTQELQAANEQLIKANTVMEETLERLNPGVSRLIGNNKQQLGLVYATEMVADICNYTKLNMILGETMMGEFMKKFFRESHILLAKYRGMLDKTVGDQIVAIFGTAKDQSPPSAIHPFDAIACAIQLVKASEKINQFMQGAIQDNYTAIVARHRSLSKEDRENARIEELKFQCRIGINTSNPSSPREIDRMRMVMMGAETCVDYTAQGGAIIYAFRLESSGKPGEIHIGENTRRLAENVYVLEDMPPITLKGLGVQRGYRVAGQQSVFETIYPKTHFYQTYAGNIPDELFHMLNHVVIGKIQLREVQKIINYIDIGFPYLEHIAGYYNLFAARALIGYAVGETLELETDRLNALMFASLWHNGLHLKNIALEELEVDAVESQVPETIDAGLVKDILKSLEQSSPDLAEANVINMANQFDQMVYDRTYLGNRAQEIMSAKEYISLMKLEEKFEGRLLETIGDLFIVESAEAEEEEAPVQEKAPFLPYRDPEKLADAIEKYLTPDERRQLASRLSQSSQEDVN